MKAYFILEVLFFAVNKCLSPRHAVAFRLCHENFILTTAKFMVNQPPSQFCYFSSTSYKYYRISLEKPGIIFRYHQYLEVFKTNIGVGWRKLQKNYSTHNAHTYNNNFYHAFKPYCKYTHISPSMQRGFSIAFFMLWTIYRIKSMWNVFHLHMFCTQICEL